MDLVLIRILFVFILALVCYFLPILDFPNWLSAITGAGGAALVIVFELRVRALSLRRLIGAVLGSILGIFEAFLFSLVLANSLPAGNTRSLLQIFVLLLMSYVGLVVGTS